MDDKFWSFIVVTAMWAGVLIYVVQLGAKLKKLEKMADNE